MGKPDSKTLNMNINVALLERIEKYRHKRMFPTRTEAIEFLLDAALRLNPDPKADQKGSASKGD